MSDNSVHSPASGLDSIDAGGSTGGAGESTIHPSSFEGLADRGAQAPSMKQNESIGGVGATSGAVEFAQLADIPIGEPSVSPDQMAGGLGNPPRP